MDEGLATGGTTAGDGIGACINRDDVGTGDDDDDGAIGGGGGDIEDDGGDNGTVVIVVVVIVIVCCCCCCCGCATSVALTVMIGVLVDCD